MRFFVAFSISFFSSLAFIYLVIRLSNRWKWFDRVDARKIHVVETSRLGGLGIFLAFVVGFLAVVSFWSAIFSEDFKLVLAGETKILLPIGLAILFAIGLLDDIFHFAALWKLLGQLLGVSLIVGGGMLIEDLTIPFVEQRLHLGFFAPILTFAWILLITNAFNLIDGLDGLAGGIALIAFSALAFVFFQNGQKSEGLIAVCLCGGLLGFLAFNFPPAKVFMGDGGSHLLGSFIAVLSVSGNASLSSHTSLLAPLALVIIPLFDTFGAVIRRIREKKQLHEPDREHMHHKLLDLGLSTRTILFIVYALATAAGILVAISFFVPKIFNDVLLIAFFVVTIGLFWRLSYVYRKNHPLSSVRDTSFVPPE